ncbi:MAG: helix-turn-helix domain-containing protein, partial [Pseudonocardiales bacterium]|nr:helix-turn-helix domain-containing protein [Pseudonocardiales bacterium]
MDLGAALTIIRTAPGLSQFEFAALLGWSQSAVARAESGERGSLYDLRRLFEVVDAVGMPREARRFQSVMATQCFAISSSKASTGFRQLSVLRG